MKCIYTESLPCERCIKSGQPTTCNFDQKLTLPAIKPEPIHPIHQPVHQNNIRLQPNVLPPISNTSLQIQSPPLNQLQTTPLPQIQNNNKDIGEMRWKSQMEDKINNFDNKLNDLVDVLRSNQQLMIQQQTQILQQQKYMDSLQDEPPVKPSETKRPADFESSQGKRQKTGEISEDFRNDVLSLKEAKELFHFFDNNITPQLFGFEIAKFSVDSIWETSPILICAICTISSIHHPYLSSKHLELLEHLHKLCGNLLFLGRPTTEVEGFNTILALIFCSFWLSDSQMFTGLALQIAKEIGLDTPNVVPGGLNKEERLKLWYLLYILDGQQSLTYNRQPLVNSNDYTLQHSRSLLMANDKEPARITAPVDTSKELDEESPAKESRKPTFTDMRLVSQVEYNQALSEAFKGNAWDLLAPSSLGIPSKSNLELDKWMVSWTVLLSPMNNGSVWSSKSTLIYYNFAKMHINSSAVRQLRTKNQTNTIEFPKLEQLEHGPERPTQDLVEPENRDWEDSSDDEEEFITNKELINQDASAVNANIAFNAAQTVLNLVINDKDIKNNLKYVPVHVHIMLYYASLLLLDDKNDEPLDDCVSHYKTLVINLGNVSSLRKVIIENLPVDKNFAERLLTSLDELIEERQIKLKSRISDADIEKTAKDTLLNQLVSLTNEDAAGKFEFFDDNLSRESSPGISAWPGSNHGHPSQQ